MEKQEKKQAIPKVVVKKVIPAKREKVFEAWTKPDIMQKWFFPGTWTAVAKNELRVGGKFIVEMIDDGSGFGEDLPGKSGEGYPHTGEYVEINPPEKLVFTWNSHLVKNSRVTVELRELGQVTELLLTHEFLETEELRKAHNQGWNGCLVNLENYFKR
jgi:uncharacterized protein YndB with AHSA1/START domain